MRTPEARLAQAHDTPAHVSGGRLDRLSAHRVQANNAAMGSVESDVARLERAAVSRFRAGHANVEHSAIGVATIGQGTLRQSNAGVVIARSLAADEVRTAVLIAPVVRGEVHTLIDLRTAVAIGFGMALGRMLFGAVRGVGRRLPL